MKTKEVKEEVPERGFISKLSLVVFALIAVFSLIIYWFFPFGVSEFGAFSGNSNFSINNSENKMQFYPNMRYLTANISYKIDNCPLEKKDEMKRAFVLLENITILNFYSVDSEEEISVTCEQKQRIEERMFIAGEGGPVNITKSGDFNIILNGMILLIRESDCEKPNIPLHELLHALGFEHSTNKNNIMYNYSNCKQTIGEDIPVLINRLYSIPNYPDLAFENISAVMNGRYLFANITIRNIGIGNSSDAKLIIKAGGVEEKNIDLTPVEFGYGMMVTLRNMRLSHISIEELEFFIESDFEELNKENNEAILQIK